jgi:hypothetical protein
MASALSSFSAYIYGEIQGQPPFAGSQPFSRAYAYSANARGNRSFPVSGTVVHPVNPGVQLSGGGAYIYAIIEEVPGGLTTGADTKKYATSTSVATLATARGE